jgi:hypothetical protein
MSPCNWRKLWEKLTNYNTLMETCPEKILTPPPPPPPPTHSPTIWGEILIIDWNVVGKCNTTPPSFASSLWPYINGSFQKKRSLEKTCTRMSRISKINALQIPYWNQWICSTTNAWHMQADITELKSCH